METSYCLSSPREWIQTHKPADEVPCYWAEVDWDVHALETCIKERDWRRERANSLEDVFHELADKWRTETKYLSAVDDIVLNKAYQSIIGIGPKVVPLLLRELQTRPAHWFWALRSITREDPVRPEDLGNVKKMTEAWLNWGREKRYL
jgi:hypothetical protein